MRLPWRRKAPQAASRPGGYTLSVIFLPKASGGPLMPRVEARDWRGTPTWLRWRHVRIHVEKLEPVWS